MSSKKKEETKTTNTQSGTQSGQFGTTNTFERLPGAESADIDRVRNMQFRVDPTIGARVGEAQRNLKASFNNPLGGYSSPQQRDAIMRSQQREIFQQSGAQTRAGQYDVNQQNYGKNAFVAGLTAPPLVQTGSSGQSSGTSSGQSTGQSNTVQTTPFSSKILPALQQGAETAAMFAGSDARLKNIEGDYHGGLSQLKRIQPKVYTWKDERVKGLQAGPIAQDVQAVLPLAINEAPDGTLQINYFALFGTLINAVKELSARVEELEK